VNRARVTREADIAVVIACHDEGRWDSLIGTISSAQSQDPAPAEVVVVVDHNPTLMERLKTYHPELTVLENQYERGASGTRNTGVEFCSQSLVAFLDDDVVAHEGWLEHLIEPFADGSVVGTGGRVDPVWQVARPPWFPDEFLFVVGASFVGVSEENHVVRNVWSENMAVRRESFERVKGFRLAFGKVGDQCRPEDTDLCIRMQAASPGAHFVYVPDAVISHLVPPRRATFGYFLVRCYSEGRGKVEMSKHLRKDRDLTAESDWFRRSVPAAIQKHLAGSMRSGGGADVLQVGAIGSGVVAAGLGAAITLGRIFLHPQRP